MPAAAVTDHGNLHGAIEFYGKATAAGIKPILGVEAYITQGDRRDRSHRHPTQHIVLLAKNGEGLRNLYHLVSLANFEGFYYKPRIDREILKKHAAGLIGLSACINGIPAKYLQENRPDLAEQAIREYRSIFDSEDYYVELMETGVPGQSEINRGLVDLAKELSVPVVATNDCHYFDQKDAKAHDVLLCIGTGRLVNDTERMKFPSDQFYVRTPKEMKELFSYCPEAISNTLEVAKKCDVSLKLGDYHMPNYPVPSGKEVEDYFDDLAREGLAERMPQILRSYTQTGLPLEGVESRYSQRLERELKMIRKTGFSGYFLIVADFINYAKKKGIPVGPGRGSAAGSIASFATKITDIDPIPLKLLFERFLNPERISMPDIDVDFCQDGRDDVIRYVAEKYGGSQALEETRVAQITTFGTLQARAVIRDVGRALGMPYGEVDRIAKMVPRVLNITLTEAFAQESKFAELRKKDSRIDELLDVAVSLEGLVRHASVHAAGIVISDDRPLVDHLPLSKGQHDEVVTQWGMKGVEKIGLIKFDFLGLKTLTLLRRAAELVQASKGVDIDLLSLDLTDPAVFELLGRAETQGVFQLESSGMRDLVVRLKPSSFEDVVALVALYRPGPLGSGMVDDFINRKQGRTKIQYDLPELEPILKDTYGVILYQEQVMQIAEQLADFSLGEADLLRRAMGKKIVEEMDKQEVRFLQGCEKKKIPKAKAKKIFDLMAKFAGYGFNKSHSAAYAMISFQTAYFKAHHPQEFMAACLSIDRSNTDRVMLLLNDCRAQGIEVLPPDVNESQLDFHVVDGSIRFGLAAVKNVGEGSILNVLRAREEGGGFQDLFDFCQRVDLRQFNRKVIESLIKCGAFDARGAHRAQMLASMERAMEGASQFQRDRISGQNSLFEPEAAGAFPPLTYDEVAPWDDGARLKAEKESLGFYMTGHPLLKYCDLLRQYANSDVEGLPGLKDQSVARLGGIITTLKEITTKKGDRMAFATLEDLSGSVELVVFADPYREKGELLKGEDPIYVVGKVDAGEDQPKIIVSDLVSLENAPVLFQGTVHIFLDATAIDESVLDQLQGVLVTHKGESRTLLHMKLPQRSETVLALSNRFSTRPSEQLVKDVNALLVGRGQISFL